MKIILVLEETANEGVHKQYTSKEPDILGSTKTRLLGLTRHVVRVPEYRGIKCVTRKTIY